MEDGERGERENRKIETGIYANRSTSPRRGSRRESGERCAEVSFRSILLHKRMYGLLFAVHSSQGLDL